VEGGAGGHSPLSVHIFIHENVVVI
jgi:hypothetical protein